MSIPASSSLALFIGSVRTRKVGASQGSRLLIGRTHRVSCLLGIDTRTSSHSHLPLTCQVGSLAPPANGSARRGKRAVVTACLLRGGELLSGLSLVGGLLTVSQLNHKLFFTPGVDTQAAGS